MTEPCMLGVGKNSRDGSKSLPLLPLLGVDFKDSAGVTQSLPVTPSRRVPRLLKRRKGWQNLPQLQMPASNPKMGIVPHTPFFPGPPGEPVSSSQNCRRKRPALYLNEPIEEEDLAPIDPYAVLLTPSITPPTSVAHSKHLLNSSMTIDSPPQYPPHRRHTTHTHTQSMQFSAMASDVSKNTLDISSVRLPHKRAMSLDFSRGDRLSHKRASIGHTQLHR